MPRHRVTAPSPKVRTVLPTAAERVSVSVHLFWRPRGRQKGLPLRRLRLRSATSLGSREPDVSSPGVTAPFGVLWVDVLAPYWLRCSSSRLPGFPCGAWSLRDIAVPATFRSRFILPWAPVRLQSMTEPARCSSSPKRVAAPPMRFVAFPRPQHLGYAVATSANPPPPSALRFSQPPGGLLPAMPCELVSSRWHA
jgi:hypothetical protein